MTVEEVVAVDPEITGALARLLPQLSSSAPPLTAEGIAAIVETPGTTVFVARAPTGEISGSLTLVVFRVPSGVRAWIEDVVVDKGARGQGEGRALVEAALEKAASWGARTVDLTSRPSREAANRLYQRIGFERRDTNLYRFTIV